MADLSLGPRATFAVAIASLMLARPVAAQAAGASATLGAWARTHAVAIPRVDAPYTDSSYRFLDSLVGSARILALGELIHRGHEPLEFRNHVVRYAVTHLGFTAFALESGFTEVALVDRFVQGGPGNVDSVLQAGLNWNFGTLPENRELVLWLRAYNAHAAHRVHVYGFDLTGGDPENRVDLYLGAPKAVWAVLDYLHEVAPDSAPAYRSQLVPLLARFTPLRYAEYSAAERSRLTRALNRLHRMLVVDSTRDASASSARAYARAVHNAWMALCLDRLLAMSPSTDPEPARARNIVRDSLMAENVRWIVRQDGDSGRTLVWAHNAHVINAPTTVWVLGPNGEGVPAGPSFRMAGQYIRAWYGADEVILLSTTSRLVGFGTSPVDPASVDAALATVGQAPFVVDLRASDRSPELHALLMRPWPFRLHTMFQRIAPRDAADAIVYFDQVTRTGGP